MAEAGDYGGTDDAASAAATPGGKGNPKPPKRARPPDVVQPPAAMKVDVPKLRAPPPPARHMPYVPKLREPVPMAGTAASVDQKAGMSSLLGISCKCSTGHCKLVLIDPDVIAEADILSMHAKAAEMQRLSKIKAGAPETGHRVVAPSKKSTVDVSFMRTRSKEGERRRVLRSSLRTLDGLSISSAYRKRRICVETRAQLLCCSVGLVTKMRRELTVEDQTAVHPPNKAAIFNTDPICTFSGALANFNLDVVPVQREHPDRPITILQLLQHCCYPDFSTLSDARAAVDFPAPDILSDDDDPFL
eukprot:m.196833 g.196833  ORF g.196833 m.196833 type:complete len:303 (+) comp25072_c0_seq6:94-1002(+)